MGVEMKVIIAGSRQGFVSSDVAEAVLNSKFTISEVVSGTARGVDTFGEQWAQQNGVLVKRFPADWDKHGRGAGYIRNRQMGDYANALIALWDGQSKGTKAMIEYMKSLGKPVHLHHLRGSSL